MKIAEKLEKDFWENAGKNPGLLRLLMTAKEKRDIACRLAAIKMIETSISPSQISRELSISRQTIYAIKKSLSEKIYKSYRERGKTERKKKVFSPLPRRPLSKDFQKYLEGRRPRRTKYGTIYTKL